MHWKTAAVRGAVFTTSVFAFRLSGYKVRAMASASANSTKRGALIFLHGLGDTPAGWSSLETQLPRLQPRLNNIEYVFPPAPTIPISINGGMHMPGWFDLYDWPIGVGVQDDRMGKLKAVQQIEKEVDKLRQKGIEKIVVGGFSQGGAIALLAAYHSAASVERQKCYVGCAVLSAWLTLMDDLKVPAASKQIPLFWGHGTFDDKVLFEQQAFGINKLKEQGVADIDFAHYPMGHASDPNEIVALASFVDRVIFGGEDKKSEL